jgi:hypothetical protein
MEDKSLLFSYHSEAPFLPVIVRETGIASLMLAMTGKDVIARNKITFPQLKLVRIEYLLNYRL